MSSLKEFYVANNKISGIPESFGQLSTLVAMDLPENLWEGVVTERHLANLSSLTDLDLYILSPNISLAYNITPRWIPPFKLSVDLSSNLYDGPLPMWSSNVTILYLNDNRFSGPIPPNIGELMPYLTDLDISRNDLNGTIPLYIGNMATLTTLVISNNGKRTPEGRLTVVAKGRFVQYDQSILYLVNNLDLSDNRLLGENPEALMSLVRLWTLNLSMNHLTGRIPIDIGNLERLETLDLSSNNLLGPLPPSMTTLTKLNHLNLSYNNLSGKIPKAN
ncbi:LRR receptor-like serine/threonine-protein kinase GSO2 [Syzygium oleosum]|uniref:LRR receptor-like serine/threonine-protein kinase GSO2 n=1 Tax=Syzygium oleosum TaxID=219896 RepID=UPI0024BBEA49|nr:LRR receptor-like serine/threonine-protein kinase GSO2 [Syzygium oleosum]